MQIKIISRNISTIIRSIFSQIYNIEILSNEEHYQGRLNCSYTY